MKEGKSGLKTYLVEVSTISKGATPSTLSYFSSQKLIPGSLVRVPIRKGFNLAVVIRSRDVKAAKTEIRRAGFLLKKIRRSDILEASLPLEVFHALEETARYYAVPIGTLLAGIVPKQFVEEPETFFKIHTGKKKKLSEHSRETMLLQMESEERFGQYRALVRQAFARGSSVMLVVPTFLDIEKVRRELSKGISEFVHEFSLEGKKSEIKKIWVDAMNDPHPILFVTTPAGLFFNRPDIDTIIMERENSRAYRTLVRPFIHLKILIERMANYSEGQLVLGDSVLSLETLRKEKNGEYGENSLIRWRLPAAPTNLVDASTKQNQEGRFEIFSEELKNLILRARAEKENVFLFGARKGLAPTTVCGDCGTVLPCLNCGAPVVLHRHGENTAYVCHACRAKRDSLTTCGYCGSWKLTPLGIGTEVIAREVKHLFPGEQVEILDKDHASTDKQAESIAKRFKEQGGILVGTELAFFHLEKVPYTAIVSLDALFSVPDFGIHERIFYLVSRIREITDKEGLVQTRNIGKQVLAWAAYGNITDFYQNEIEERNALLYPPFSIFIKITAQREDYSETLRRLKEQFAEWKPDIFKDSIVMRIPKDLWPDEELSQKLSLLGPDFNIKVDPESIL